MASSVVLSERLVHGEQVARSVTNTWLARGAVTAVLAVTGTAFLLVALAVFDAAPLAGVAAVTIASWIASARFVKEP